MSRFDALGMFWEDLAPVKPPKKEKVKAVPPEPVWLAATYLPGLHEARNMILDLFTVEELIEASRTGERLNYDIECYPNYFLLTARGIDGKKCVCFEAHDDEALSEEDQQKLTWVLENFTMVGFNILHYDNTMATIAAAGATTEQLWLANCKIFEKADRKPGDTGMPRPKYKAHQILKAFKVKKLAIDSIDLIQYTAGAPSLKKLAGRIHSRRMQDLPFVPGTYLTPDQKLIVKWYNINDLDIVELVYAWYLERVQLREKLSTKYNIDLRSKSDAQMAEAIMESEIKKLTKQTFIVKDKVEVGKTFQYKKPAFIDFHTEQMQEALKVVLDSEMVISAKGSVILPQSLKDLEIRIGKGLYTFGIGGLHSNEKSVGHVSDEKYQIVDIDATSFYPFLMLNAGMTPKNLGKAFLVVYNGVVVDRVNAKKAGDIIAAEGLKITANGTYGKLGSRYSIMYAPELLIQVTITGQLVLLMYIEMMEYQGFEVISANTDGIVCMVERERKQEFDDLVKYWESRTGLSTEETLYEAVYSRDVNTYVAIYTEPEKQKGKLFKSKGNIFNIRHPDKSSDASTVDLKKNPVTEICTYAIIEKILHGTPIETTIRECTDASRFVEVREVKGGGVYLGAEGYIDYLGKTVRWYHATGVGSDARVVYAKSGNKVANSDSSKPLMTLPVDGVPDDINYEWYEQKTRDNMIVMGYTKGEVSADYVDETEDDEQLEEETT